MRTGHLSVLLCAAVLIGCGPRWRALEWVEKTTPERMLADANRTGRLHFLTVCGFTCREPTIGGITYAHCYAAIPKVVVDPTGDVVASRREGQLKDEVEEFAERYNTLVRTELDSAGRRTCPSGERWDDYFYTVDSIARLIPANPYVSYVAGLLSVGGGKPDFELHVYDERTLAPRLYRQLCALAPKFGLLRRVGFTVTSGDPNRDLRTHPGLACLNGDVAT